MDKIECCDCWYAKEIIKIAKAKGYTVKKSQKNIAYEIKVHIIVYRLKIDLGHGNPVDIELYTSNWIAPRDWDQWIPSWEDYVSCPSDSKLDEKCPGECP